MRLGGGVCKDKAGEMIVMVNGSDRFQCYNKSKLTVKSGLGST